LLFYKTNSIKDVEMSNSFFYNSVYMKSTDTVIGAFGVLGIVLLAVFAFAGSTSDQEVNMNTADTGNEEVLVDATTADEEVINPEVATKTEEVVVAPENDEAVLNLSDLSNRVSNIFPANPDTDLTLETTTDSEVAVVDETATNSTQEVVIDEPAAGEDIVLESEEADTQVLDDKEVVTEVDSSSDEPGRISKFFSNLFGGDDNNDSDVGGNSEDEVDDDSVDISAEGTYVVESGDTIWDILTTDLELSNAQAATIINDMRTDSNMASQFGVTSGSVDLIYVGQSLDLSAL
jgi:hypothetical protein